MSDVHGPDLVIDLPTSLSCCILSDWIPTVDLARLDSAYCCNKKRGVVLDMLRSKEFLSKDDLPSHRIYCVSKEYWDWILRRDIKLFYITTNSFGADEQKLESYAKRHEQYIGHLDLTDVNLNSLALHCKHLVQVACNVTRSPAFETVLLNNPNLRILDLHGLKEEHIESLKTIRLPNLTQLGLEVVVCSAQLVAAVLAMPVRLLKLDLRDVNTDLTGVAQHCPHLRSLNLAMLNYGFKVDEFTSYLPHLVNLQLLNFTELQDAELLAVVRNLKELRFLSLQFWNECNLTDTGIGYIAEHCAATLEVFRLGISESGTDITRGSQDLLRARCTKLRQFRVEAFYNGYSNMPLGSVTHLVVIEPCAKGTLARISDSYPQLEVLEMESDADCSLPTLRELCQKCPKLHRVVVDKWCMPNIQSLAASLPQLLVTDRSSDLSLDVMKMPI